MRLHTSCILAAAIALNAAWADAPRFDRIFGSHMVLPHGKNIPVGKYHMGTEDPVEPGRVRPRRMKGDGGSQDA